MTATALFALAGVGVIGYLVGRRGSADPGRRVGDASMPTRTRSWPKILGLGLVAVVLLAWLTPGPGLFGPRGPSEFFEGDPRGPGQHSFLDRARDGFGLFDSGPGPR